MQIIDKSMYTFSKDNEPVATAKPGETLLFKTMDCFGDQISSEDQLVHEIDFSLANPAAGPVFVEGAEIGDVLVVDILDIQVEEKGFACTLGDLGPLSAKSETRTRVFEVKDGRTSFNGISWLVQPMVGVIGTAPAEGAVPTGYPGNHGGNMDSKIIQKGVRMYFPVRTKGALLQIGDLHASMGDGELSGTGIEIRGEVTARVDVIKDFELNWPVTETCDRIYVNTSAIEYEDALVAATNEMARLMEPVYKWDITDTAVYFSVQGDIEVNQSTRPMGDNDVGMTLRFGIPKSPEVQSLIK